MAGGDEEPGARDRGEHGAQAASERCGIPACTIRSWMHRAQKHVEVVTNGAVVVPARTAVGYRTTWRERQPAIVEQLAGVVELALEQTRRSLHEGRMRDAQHGAVTAGICVDKVLLLTGQATTRSEQFRVNVDATDIAAKIRALEVELGYKPRELE